MSKIKASKKKTTATAKATPKISSKATSKATGKATGKATTKSSSKAATKSSSKATTKAPGKKSVPAKKVQRDVLTITKKQLVEKISLKTGQTKVRTKETVQLFLDTITSELKSGNRIELRDFGVFEVKERAARVGRNPRTGDTVRVPARKVVSFKVGRKMKQYVADSKDSN